MGKSPIQYEKDNIKAMMEVAKSKNYRFIALAAKGNCYYLNPPRLNYKCWDNRKIKKQLKEILKQVSGYRKIILIGFSNGAYFLGGALERNLLDDISKVGIISGGSVWMKNYPKIDAAPDIYIENATRDKWNKRWVRELYDRVSTKIDSQKVHYREKARVHHPSPKESSSFLYWMLEDEK